MNDTLTVKQKFPISNHVASTRSADLYRATMAETKRDVLLWTLRYPLQNGQVGLGRLEKIKSMQLPEIPLLEAGLDVDGTLYAIFPSIDLVAIKGKLSPKESERRLIPCLKLVGKLHDANISCGDLSSNSFWCDRNSSIYFLGIMGTHDGFASGTAVLPPLETLQYMAPEQRSGAENSKQTDVFALGVLAYELFTGQSPWNDAQLTSGDLSNPELPSSKRPGLPSWVDEIVLQALSANPADRFADASEMVQAIAGVRPGSMRKNDLPVRSGSASGASGRGNLLQQMQAGNETPVEDETAEAPERGPNRNSLLFAGIAGAAALLIGLGVFAVFRIANSSPAKPQEENALQQHRSATNDLKIKMAIDTLAEKDQSMEKKVDGIKELAGSDDPLTHELLLSSAVESKTAEQRSASEQALVARTTRLGYGRSAEQIRLWFKIIAFPEVPEKYELIVRAANPTQTEKEVEPVLKNIYASDPGLAMRLTVARGLDSGNPSQYEPLLREFVGDQRRLSQAAVGTWATLTLEEMDLAVVFSEEAIEALPQADAESLRQLTMRLAERNDSLLQTVSKVLAEKKFLTPAGQRIITILSQREDLPSGLQAVLARMALGTDTEADFLTFSQWIDPQSEQILYALAASSPRPINALELLAGRTLLDRPMATLVDRIRSSYWDQREALAKAVGIFGLRAQMDKSALVEAVKSFSPVSDDKKVISALLGLGDERILQIVIETFPGKVGIGALLKLLDSKDVPIRITAVKSLQSFNDVSALKLILEYYDKEKNEDVRKAYRDTFWDIAEKRP